MDLFVSGGTVVTMDAEHRVIEDGASGDSRHARGNNGEPDVRVACGDHAAMSAHRSKSAAQTDEFARASRAAKFILVRTKLRPKVAVVLGSGLGAFADELGSATRIPYQKIPNFPRPPKFWQGTLLVLLDLLLCWTARLCGGTAIPVVARICGRDIRVSIRHEKRTATCTGNVLRALHATGKKVGLHSFRRFRTETLRRARVPEVLTKLRLGQSKNNMIDLYASGLSNDSAKWRKELRKQVLEWRARRDLNPRPCAPEAHALSN